MTTNFHRAFRMGLLAAVALGVGTTAPARAAYMIHLQSLPVSMVLASADGKTKIQTGAENFISSMAQRALDFLGNTQQTQAQKEESFRRLLEDNYDMDSIGRFTLGRYWRSATAGQRAEFQKLFRGYVVAVYSKRFSDYKGQKFETLGSRPDGDTDTIVSSKIDPVDGGEPVAVDWRVRYKDGHYRVVDVVVAGVSMSVTQRSDFASVIQQGGGNVDALLESLKQKT